VDDCVYLDICELVSSVEALQGDNAYSATACNAVGCFPAPSAARSAGFRRSGPGPGRTGGRVASCRRPDGGPDSEGLTEKGGEEEVEVGAALPKA